MPHVMLSVCVCVRMHVPLEVIKLGLYSLLYASFEIFGLYFKQLSVCFEHNCLHIVKELYDFLEFLCIMTAQCGRNFTGLQIMQLFLF